MNTNTYKPKNDHDKPKINLDFSTASAVLLRWLGFRASTVGGCESVTSRPLEIARGMRGWDRKQRKGASGVWPKAYKIS